MRNIVQFYSSELGDLCENVHTTSAIGANELARVLIQGRERVVDLFGCRHHVRVYLFRALSHRGDGHLFVPAHLLKQRSMESLTKPLSPKTKS